MYIIYSFALNSIVIGRQYWKDPHFVLQSTLLKCFLCAKLTDLFFY